MLGMLGILGISGILGILGILGMSGILGMPGISGMLGRPGKLGMLFVISDKLGMLGTTAGASITICACIEPIKATRRTETTRRVAIVSSYCFD